MGDIGFRAHQQDRNLGRDQGCVTVEAPLARSFVHETLLARVGE
jgi:hypothetical protein